MLLSLVNAFGKTEFCQTKRNIFIKIKNTLTRCTTKIEFPQGEFSVCMQNSLKQNVNIMIIQKDIF